MKQFVIFLLLGVTFVLNACSLSDGNLSEENQRRGDDTVKLTKEYVLAHSDLTEADFEGIDFENFVSRYELTPERLKEYDPAMVLALYKDSVNQEIRKDYIYIYEMAKGSIREPEINLIEKMIWEYHSGNYNDCMVIDRKAEAVYYGLGYFLSECGESNRVADFCEEDAAFLERLLRESRIADWKNTYIGTSEGTTGSFSWAVGLQLNDGRCFQYSGEGVLDSGTPNTLRPMMDELIERFSEK